MNDDLTKSKPHVVGDKQPPKHSQFKPGQSGNPKGRPKGSVNLKNRVAQQLQKLATVSKNGKPVKMSKADIIANKLVEASMQGNLSAAKLVLQLDEQAAQSQASDSAGDVMLLPDKTTLKQIEARLKRLVED